MKHSHTTSVASLAGVRSIVLRNNDVVMVRPLLPTDASRLEQMARLCRPEDLRLRFLHKVGVGNGRLCQQLVELDPSCDFAYLAFEPGSAIPIGVGRVHGNAHGSAEFALLIRSDKQGHGLGRHLMELLFAKARERGLDTIHGLVLPENNRMLSLAASMGFEVKWTRDGMVLVLQHLQKAVRSDTSHANGLTDVALVAAG